MPHDDWAGGLFGCIESNGCGMCVLGFFCPSIVYGVNYGIATNKENWVECILPFMSHQFLDNCSWSLSSALHCGASIAVPLGCFLRYNHRRAAVDLAKSTESKTDSFCSEIFCWSCSVSQVNRQFRTHHLKRENGFTNNDNFLLGTISGPFVTNSIDPSAALLSVLN
jgi:Cys-rich protein (TIGR01571 family)